MTVPTSIPVAVVQAQLSLQNQLSIATTTVQCSCLWLAVFLSSSVDKYSWPLMILLLGRSVPALRCVPAAELSNSGNNTSGHLQPLLSVRSSTGGLHYNVHVSPTKVKSTSNDTVQRINLGDKHRKNSSKEHHLPVFFCSYRSAQSYVYVTTPKLLLECVTVLQYEYIVDVSVKRALPLCASGGLTTENTDGPSLIEAAGNLTLKTVGSFASGSSKFWIQVQGIDANMDSACDHWSEFTFRQHPMRRQF